MRAKGILKECIVMFIQVLSDDRLSAELIDPLGDFVACRKSEPRKQGQILREDSSLGAFEDDQVDLGH